MEVRLASNSSSRETPRAKEEEREAKEKVNPSRHAMCAKEQVIQVRIVPQIRGTASPHLYVTFAADGVI